jgi:polysaccharide deacetylase 2 family uncharacterized protein YibQ
MAMNGKRIGSGGCDAESVAKPYGLSSEKQPIFLDNSNKKCHI